MKSSEKFSDNHEITLESVKKDFELWRQTKTTHRIPEYLWDKVLLLLKCHGMGLVCNTLINKLLPNRNKTTSPQIR